MYWIALYFLCMNTVVLQARHDLNIKKLIEIIRRRNSLPYYNHANSILEVPRYPEHLPEAEPILPGHTLIRPSKNMLKSAAKYPLRDLGGSLVYGNIANIGLADDSQNRVMYTNFRKANDLLSQLAHYIKKVKRNERSRPVLIMDPAILNGPNPYNLDSVVTHTDNENDAREILDELDPKRIVFEENSSINDFRRKKSKSKFRMRSNEMSDSETEAEDTSGSSEYERNPGNPYTIHKNKYKQNWMWNHFMDGDHMNVNPHAPKFKIEGPSGPELFFGRKWWYFNQDDYKPMR